MKINNRIELTDTVTSAIIKLVEGNAGAATVLLRTINEGTAIDPDSLLGDISAMLSLDTIGIYGSRIWLLYKDVCGQNLTNMIGLLRAVQLGFLSESRLNDVIDGTTVVSSGWVDGYVDQVKRHLPNFGKVPA